MLNVLVELVDVGREALKVGDDELVSQGAGDQNDIVDDETENHGGNINLRITAVFVYFENHLFRISCH